MKVIFFGSSRYVVPILEMLHNEHQVPLVITTEQGTQEPVKFFCHTHNITCISVKKSGELIANYELQTVKAEVGVVADFGIIIPQEVLNFFPKGMVNIHPSLLPLYRGPTPAQTAILNADVKSGVSIIALDKFMDHGPILEQKEELIDSKDTAKSLYEKLFKLGIPLLSKTLNNYEHGTSNPKPQNHDQATFTKILNKEDGFFDYKTNKDLAFLNNLTRAYYPWPGAWTKVKLNPNSDEKIVKFLPENKIQVEGGKEMAIKDFINGYTGADKNFLEILKKMGGII